MRTLPTSPHPHHDDHPSDTADLAPFRAVPQRPPTFDARDITPATATPMWSSRRSMIVMGSALGVLASAAAGWWVHSRWSYLAMTVAVGAVSFVAVLITQPEPAEGARPEG